MKIHGIGKKTIDKSYLFAYKNEKMCRKGAKSTPKMCRKGANNSKFPIKMCGNIRFFQTVGRKIPQKDNRSVLEASLGEKVAKVGKTI